MAPQSGFHAERKIIEHAPHRQPRPVVEPGMIGKIEIVDRAAQPRIGTAIRRRCPGKQRHGTRLGAVIDVATFDRHASSI